MKYTKSNNRGYYGNYQCCSLYNTFFISIFIPFIFGFSLTIQILLYNTHR